MSKKINSEYKLTNCDEKILVSMGTANKKNPEVIYSTLSTYITPQIENVEEINFDFIEKEIKKYIKNLLVTNNICTNNTIIVFDCAYNRLELNKPSFFNIQIYFKPTNITLEKEKYIFKNISESIYKLYIIKINEFIKNILTKNDLILSKIKNKIEHKITK